MHDVGVMLAGEYIAGAAHVGGELIDIIETSIDDRATKALIAQVANDEVIGVRLRIFMKFEIDAPNPIAFFSQAFYEMAADESPGSTDKRFPHDNTPVFDSDWKGC
jgi:hypothetical protein